MGVIPLTPPRSWFAFPGGAWERTASQALPSVGSLTRRSLVSSAFPGGAWERGQHASFLLVFNRQRHHDIQVVARIVAEESRFVAVEQFQGQGRVGVENA